MRKEVPAVYADCLAWTLESYAACVRMKEEPDLRLNLVKKMSRDLDILYKKHVC